MSLVAAAVKAEMKRGNDAALLVFDDSNGGTVELDLRGSAAEVRARHGQPGGASPAEPEETPVPRRPPGRPRLGVVGREVTLLPRHWEWLQDQPGGASVTLRRLVEQARRDGAGTDRRRRSREAAYRVMTALAGDLPGFEEATRALFAGHRDRFDEHTADWPSDLAEYAAEIAADGFGEPNGIDR
jgi:hypothetical protein